MCIESANDKVLGTNCTWGGGVGGLKRMELKLRSYAIG